MDGSFRFGAAGPAAPAHDTRATAADNPINQAAERQSPVLAGRPCSRLVNLSHMLFSLPGKPLSAPHRAKMLQLFQSEFSSLLNYSIKNQQQAQTESLPGRPREN